MTVRSTQFPLIDSPQNPKIKDALDLRESRSRRDRKEFLIEGRRELNRAFDSKVEITAVFVLETSVQNLEIESFTSKLSNQTKIYSVSPRVYEKLAMREGTEHVIAIGRDQFWTLEQVVANPRALVVLDGLEKPGNLGAILRSMDGAGATGVMIASERAIDYYNPNAIRSSQGAIFAIPWIVKTDQDLRDALVAKQISVVALDPAAQLQYFEMNLSVPTALVVGNEASGLSNFWQHNVDARIKVPMVGICDSLNASVSMAIVLYEALRQRLISNDFNTFQK